MSLVNLTPHALCLHFPDGSILTIPASGTVARTAATRTRVGSINGLPVHAQTFGEVGGLPAPVEGTTYIVSGIVLAALKGTRPDVVGPDTGDGAVRNDKNQIVGTTGFVV